MTNFSATIITLLLLTISVSIKAQNAKVPSSTSKNKGNASVTPKIPEKNDYEHICEYGQLSMITDKK